MGQLTINQPGKKQLDDHSVEFNTLLSIPRNYSIHTSASVNLHVSPADLMVPNPDMSSRLHLDEELSHKEGVISIVGGTPSCSEQSIP